MKKDTKKRLFDVMSRIDETFKPNLNEDENDSPFNAAGEPRMTHQQYRDYSEPAEPDYDADRDMPVPPPKGIGDFRDIDWKVLHGIFLQNREALQGGNLTSAVNVGDLTDYDGYLSQEELDLIDAAGLIYSDGVFPLIEDDKYLDYQTFYNKAQEVWQNPEKYMIRSYTRGGDDSEAPYLRGREPMDEIDYETAKSGEQEYQQRIKTALQEFDNQEIELGIYGDVYKYPTELQVILNTYDEENPYSVAIYLNVHDDRRNQLIGIGLHGTIKAEQVFWKEYSVKQIPQETMIFFENFIRKAAPFVGIQDEAEIDAMIKYADQKMGMENKLEENYSNLSLGAKVKVSDGSGLASNKIGTIVPPREVKTDGRGVPINVQGAYKPVDWSKEVAVRLDDGELITMFKNRLTRI